MLGLMTTRSANHLRSNGVGLYYVSYNIDVTPADPLVPTTSVNEQEYPINKFYQMRQMFTAYGSFENGDYVELGSETYAIKSSNFYDAQGKMSAYYQLIVERIIE